MFGYSLTHDQERAVLELLGFVATFDRDVTADEKQYVVELSHDFNASADGIFEADPETTLESVCAAFQDPTARRLALVYAIQLGFVDGLYDEEEWLGVRNIGDALNIPDRDVADLEDWVHRGLEWEKEGRKLLDLPSKWAV